MNLTVFPGSGDLELSFFHIARLMDNNGVGPGNERQCVDCGDVQIRTDGDASPTVDNWGFWNKLVPFENIYDHKPNAFSVFGSYYCEFTPTDAGPNPAAAYGIKETICYPLGTWSRCGSTTATTAPQTGDCAGPGEVDPSGVGVWVKSRFNLAGYLGQRIEIRWIAETWVFDAVSSSYFEIGPGWNNTTADDGWWLDDIRVSGTVAQQFTPTADLAPRTGVCPSDPCNQGVADAGTNVILKITDLNGTVMDGVTNVVSAGQSIHVTAINSSLPGGCMNGVAEYEFSKDGVVVQVFGPKTYYLDAPDGPANYSARARCSSDFTCTSVAGASIALTLSTGNGTDTFFGEVNSPADRTRGVQYFRGVCNGGTIGLPCTTGYCTGGGVGANTGTPCTASAICTVGGTCASVVTDCGNVPTAASCNVTAVVTDDTTVLRAFAPGAPGLGLDLIHGSVPTGPAPKGARVGALWNLAGLLPAVPPPPATLGCQAGDTIGAATLGGSNYRVGPLNQTADPNPAVGSVVYYDVSRNAGGGPGFNDNAFGVSNPAICSNSGWCELGPTPGIACEADANCGAGGYCALNRCVAPSAGLNVGKGCNTDAQCGAGGQCGATLGVLDPVVPTFCTTDTGVADLGGCGKHGVCGTGTFAGRLCTINTDCATSGVTCVLPGPTAGQTCYNSSSGPINPITGAPVGAIAGKLLIEQIAPGGPAAFVCP
jgi:hypothetical protein